MDEIKIRKDKLEKIDYMQSKLHTSLWNIINLIGAPAATTRREQHKTSAKKFSVVERSQRRVGKSYRPMNLVAPCVKLQPAVRKIGETFSD